MNVRLRVLIAVAATAALGVMGVVAAVPASAASGYILSIDLNSAYGIPSGTDMFDEPVYVSTETAIYETDCGAGMTYQGEDYCEVRMVASPRWCLDYANGNGNPVYWNTCNSKRIAQDWWWSGQRFRNLYATELGVDACMNVDTETLAVDVYLCDVNTSKWSF
jgi:hypothetical protein